jgi:hypothetical protein
MRPYPELSGPFFSHRRLPPVSRIANAKGQRADIADR